MRFCCIHRKAPFPTRAQATYQHDEFENFTFKIADTNFPGGGGGGGGERYIKPSPPSAA